MKTATTTSTTATPTKDDPVEALDASGATVLTKSTSATPTTSLSVSDTSSSSPSSSSDDDESDFGAIRRLSSNTSNSSSAATTSFSARWTAAVHRIHRPLMAVLQGLTRVAATFPRVTIASVVSFSLLLLIVGFATNFELNVDEGRLWTPIDSLPLRHSNWLEQESGFAEYKRVLALFFHRDGDNVLTREFAEQVFEAFDAVRQVPGYDEACRGSDYVYPAAGPEETCEVFGAVRFWYYDSERFRQEVATDGDLKVAMSGANYPDGAYVDENNIFGYPVRDNATHVLESALSYALVIALPDHDAALAWERRALRRVQELMDEWDRDPTRLTLNLQSTVAFGDEFTRGIVMDMPLVPVVFLIMSLFTMTVFARRNRVFSRSFLGFGAVVAVLLSIMAGYGLLFIIGVPFTSMTQILPFIIFGIGIDDAIILINSFSRTDSTKDAVQRIEETINDAGISISLTTITSAVAFALGCMSSVPAIIWLCYYAAPTIVIVYFYQLTFFVACIVLDEQRVAAGRLDCCLCVRQKNFDVAIEKEILEGGLYEPIADRFMVWYADKLLRPRVKFAVAVAFAALTGLCAWSTSNFTQAFEFTDVLPDDSFISDFKVAAEQYSLRTSLIARAYFRDVDQSDPRVQEQMLGFMEDLIAMDSVTVRPQAFWLWHFNEYVNQTASTDQPFNEQLASFLSIQIFHDLYSKEILRDDDGNIISSRGYYFMDGVNFDNVQDQISALYEQRDVTADQPINEGREDYAFFSYSGYFPSWEFFSRCVGELIVTTVASVTAVVCIAALLIPHWSAALFSLPLICVLYVDLMGVLQWGGIHINAVSYIGLAMSVGLLVDFVMHILMRYYEVKGTREEKTKEMLRTMGSSILIGGISTFLGTLPLAFAATNIFYIIFITFLGIVTLGMGHGLVLLPVVLSTFGPEDEPPSDTDSSSTDSEDMAKAKRKNIKFEI